MIPPTPMIGSAPCRWRANKCTTCVARSVSGRPERPPTSSACFSAAHLAALDRRVGCDHRVHLMFDQLVGDLRHR